MVPNIDLIGLLREGGAVIEKDMGVTFIGGRYHGPSNKGKIYTRGAKKGLPMPPSWWDQRFPDGLDVRVSNGMAIFLLLSGGCLGLWAFFDYIVQYLDKMGYRKTDNTMWNDLMNMGILGGNGMQNSAEDVKKWLEDRKKELEDALGG